MAQPFESEHITDAVGARPSRTLRRAGTMDACAMSGRRAGCSIGSIMPILSQKARKNGAPSFCTRAEKGGYTVVFPIVQMRLRSFASPEERLRSG